MAGLTGRLVSGGETLLRVDRSAPGDLPAGQSATVVVAIQAGPDAAHRVLAEARNNRAALRFDGQLQLAAPPALRRMLLGSSPAAPHDSSGGEESMRHRDTEGQR